MKSEVRLYAKESHGEIAARSRDFHHTQRGELRTCNPLPAGQK